MQNWTKTVDSLVLSQTLHVKNGVISCFFSKHLMQKRMIFHGFSGFFAFFLIFPMHFSWLRNGQDSLHVTWETPPWELQGVLERLGHDAHVLLAPEVGRRSHVCVCTCVFFLFLNSLFMFVYFMVFACLFVCLFV